MKKSYHLTLFNHEYVREQAEIDFKDSNTKNLSIINLTEKEFQSMKQFDKKYHLFISPKNEIMIPFAEQQGNIVDIYVNNERITSKRIHSIMIMNFSEIKTDEILASGYNNKKELIQSLEDEIKKQNRTNPNRNFEPNYKVKGSDLITAWYLI